MEINLNRPVIFRDLNTRLLHIWCSIVQDRKIKQIINRIRGGVELQSKEEVLLFKAFLEEYTGGLPEDKRAVAGPTITHAKDLLKQLRQLCKKERLNI